MPVENVSGTAVPQTVLGSIPVSAKCNRQKKYPGECWQLILLPIFNCQSICKLIQFHFRDAL